MISFLIDLMKTFGLLLKLVFESGFHGLMKSVLLFFSTDALLMISCLTQNVIFHAN